MKKTFKLMLYALLSLALFVCVVVLLFFYLSRPPANDSAEVYFRIQEGEHLAAVAQRLENHALIRSARIMRIVARITERDTLIQSGSYAIPTMLTVTELLDYLTTGRQVLIKVTIPEGLTINEIATLLDEKGITDADSFTRATRDTHILETYRISAEHAEGYLFPETYFFQQRESAERVVIHMIEDFFENIRTHFPELIAYTPDDLHDLITIASIIEAEYLDTPDAALISSVIQNRLKRNMRLEACSTIVYIITEIEHLEHPQKIYFSDLERDSPYNTYRNSGLPPTPIANPGTIAINAALNPAQTNYLYFVLESADAKTHRFSETFDAHNQARVIFIRSRR